MKPSELALAGLPEELFIVHPDAPRAINLDVLSCCIARADGVLTAVICSGESDSECFSLSKEALLGALWSIEGELAQIKALIAHASTMEVLS